VSAAQLSVIVPAYNEATSLPNTLARLDLAVSSSGAEVEVVVVDDASTDGTREVAQSCGARVVAEARRGGVARARNSGAAAAVGDVLVFVDADVLVPQATLARVVRAMAEPGCIGGAFDTDYRPHRRVIALYLRFWRAVGLLFRMAQGACQFCSREAFEALGGYDERQWMGEDVEFWWRLRRLARRRGEHVEHVRDLKVVPSCRRFDQWPVWRTLVFTNPVTVTLLARRRRAWWSGWYEAPPR
jgi:glycosyltransferase involved in cell wall biosynthesis